MSEFSEAGKYNQTLFLLKKNYVLIAHTLRNYLFNKNIFQTNEILWKFPVASSWWSDLFCKKEFVKKRTFSWSDVEKYAGKYWHIIFISS